MSGANSDNAVSIPTIVTWTMMSQTRGQTFLLVTGCTWRAVGRRALSLTAQLINWVVTKKGERFNPAPPQMGWGYDPWTKSDLVSEPNPIWSRNQIRFGLGTKSDLVSEPNPIWSRNQLGFGLGANLDLVSDPKFNLVSDPGLSGPGYSEDGYSEVTWNPVTPKTTIMWCSTSVISWHFFELFFYFIFILFFF